MSAENFSHDKNCYVCGIENKKGLQLQFFSSGQGQAESFFFPAKHFQSYENTLHGGIQSLLVDSCMVQAIRTLGFSAKTAKLELRYRHQIHLEKELLVKAFVVKKITDFFVVEAEILQGEVVKTRAVGTFKKI